MPQKTLHESQAEAAAVAEALYVTSIVATSAAWEQLDAEDDPLFSSDDDDLADAMMADGDTGFAELLELAALHWAEHAASLSGSGSRGPYNAFPKPHEYFTVMLQAPDRWFRHEFRIGRDMFDRLVHLLAENPIFVSTGKKPQRPVKYQLGAFLVRYGRRGSDTLEAAKKLALGHGTVEKYCYRVSKALRQLKTRYLAWPSDVRKLAIALAIENSTGFPKCVGMGDGSLIRFTEAPLEWGTAFMGRKKFFGTNIQATIDHEKRFTSYETAWPASVTDIRIFKQSHLWQHRHKYFKDGEYILVDKGYITSPYTMRPFDEVELGHATPTNAQRMRKFNQRLSTMRVRVENAFAMLKGRFPSLKDLGQHRNLDNAYKAIEAMMVVHNLGIDWGDKPEDILGFDPHDDWGEEDVLDGLVDPGVQRAFDGDAEIPEHETEEWLRMMGRQKRWELLEELF